MPRGNASDPFSARGLDWGGNSDSDRGSTGMRGTDGADPSDRWGADDFGHIDAKANRRGLRQEDGIGNEQTVVDKPLNPSTSRVKRTSSDEYYPDNWYGTPPRRE